MKGFDKELVVCKVALENDVARFDVCCLRVADLQPVIGVFFFVVDAVEHPRLTTIDDHAVEVKPDFAVHDVLQQVRLVAFILILRKSRICAGLRRCRHRRADCQGTGSAKRFAAWGLNRIGGWIDMHILVASIRDGFGPNCVTGETQDAS